MDIFVIKDLEEDCFFLNGSLYLKKGIKDKNERVRIKKIGSGPSEIPVLTMEFNFFSALKPDAYFKKKIKNDYAQIEEFKNVDFEGEKFLKGEKEKLKKEFLKGDELILISKTNTGTMHVCDPKISSIIYFKSDDGINFGFLISRFFLELIIELNEVKNG